MAQPYDLNATFTVLNINGTFNIHYFRKFPARNAP